VRTKLRHPINSIREPFGTAGLIIACIALIAALGGTALAAAKLNSKQKKEVEKIAKKFAGKPGAAGANGAPGAKGDAGAAGANGTNGTNGAPGANVTQTAIPAGGECGAGVSGVNYTLSGTSTKICNGKNGTTGFTETLPPEKTETGAWGFGPAMSSEFLSEEISFSFAIPLADPLVGESTVHYINPAGKEVFGVTFQERNPIGTPPSCAGNAANPTAEPGNLCIYAAVQENGVFASTTAIHGAGSAAAGASTAGAILTMGVAGSEGSGAWGSYAVTAP
jgi:hypothetical protein